MLASSISPEEAYALLANGTAPEGLSVSGVLDYSPRSQRQLPPLFPAGLRAGLIDLSGTAIAEIPRGWKCFELNLSGTSIRGLPADLQVDSRLDLSRCELLEQLPTGLTVGTLNLESCTNLKELPEGLDVWFLNLTGCWAFEHWPDQCEIRGGRLQLRGCNALRTFPKNLKRLAALSIRDCPNFCSIPPDLIITGWLELAQSGLVEEDSLPSGLDRTQLRWAGINIDRRIAFHPESITVDEILVEQNAERRRVLLDRYGYGRFLQDAQAEILETDRDPGGERQLLRMKMDDDEDLVAMSCYCPSTARQYVIRVPPTTESCRHAAAWIAGFDDPNDYQPLIET